MNITLQQIQDRQAELLTLIEKFESQAMPTIRHIPEVKIALEPGEHYAGIRLSDGEDYHIVLMAPRPEALLGWYDAVEWAKSVGGELPNRQEQPLLYANCKPQLLPVCHWSSETHEPDASFAWDCDFSSGYQYYGHKSLKIAAVAIRRVPVALVKESPP